jgi:hypothetical protein
VGAVVFGCAITRCSENVFRAVGFRFTIDRAATARAPSNNPTKRARADLNGARVEPHGSSSSFRLLGRIFFDACCMGGVHMSAIATNKETTAVSTARRVLTAYEVAPLIGRGHNQVRELVRAGKLRALPGRNIKIPLESVNEFLATATREAK